MNRTMRSGVGVGERLEQDGVDDGEDGGVGSDAEGERGDGSEGKAGIVGEHAQRMLDVVPEGAHSVLRWEFACDVLACWSCLSAAEVSIRFAPDQSSIGCECWTKVKGSGNQS